MKKLSYFAAIIIALWACLPGLASAHAYILKSTPLQEAELTESPSVIRIQFTEKIDAKLSAITLENMSSGAAIDGKLSSEGDATLLYTIPKLPEGVYKVSWQVLSLDTHMTDGSFRFSVGAELGQTKPDETVSLDGSPEASPAAPADESGGASQASTKPGASESVKPSATPAQSPAPTPTPPAGESAATASPATGHGEEQSGHSGSHEAAEEQADPSESTEPSIVAAAPEAAEGPAGSLVSPQSGTIDSKDEGISAAGDHGTGHNHAEAEHEHGGRQGVMAVLRIFDILAGVSVLGLLFFRLILWRGEAEAPFGFSLRAERFVTGGAALIWIISGMSRLSMLSEQFGGVPIHELAAETMTGKLAVLRPAGAVLILLLAFAPERERWWANALKFAAAGALVLTFPLTGHAYAAVNGAAAAVASHAAHMSAAAIWFGGLTGLLSLTFPSRAAGRINETATRFSAWALPAMALVLASGIWLSAARLSSFGEIFSTAYGRLVLIKSGLMLLVLVIAAVHRKVYMPRIAEGKLSRGMRLGIRAEVLLAACLFITAGMLSTTPPPPSALAQQQQSEPFYWHVMGDEAHMSLRIGNGSGSREEQKARLDVWLPEGLGAPTAATASVLNKADGGSLSIPLELQPPAAELYEYPGFTKYTYLASGYFVNFSEESLITVDVGDQRGNSFHYERTVGGGLTAR